MSIHAKNSWTASLLKTFSIYLSLQVEDLSRMFRLFSRIIDGLPPVSKTFQEVLYYSHCCIALHF